MAKTPLALVSERFESKEKLVAAVTKLATADLWLDRVNEDRGLGRISNAKLIRLHDALEDAKKRFGSRDKLIAKICENEKRGKDEGLKTRLAGYPLPRLLDIHDSGAKRAARTAAKPAAAKAVKKPSRSKKAQAKRAAK